LLNKYKEKLLFIISYEQHYPQLVISKDCLEKQNLTNILEMSRCNTVKRAAAILREDVTNVINEATILPWPPTVESLKSDARNPPATLALFYNNLLSAANSHHVASSTTDRYVASFSQDVMHAVSHGDFVTLKRATLGLGLHSLTGQKLPLVVLSRLGHSINYDRICEIETAQAELAQHFQSMSLYSPVMHVDAESKVTTTFWWDSFDRNVETASGAGSIHNTPGIVFQEESESTVTRDTTVSIPRSKRRSLKNQEEEYFPFSTINPKVEPPSFAENNAVHVEQETEEKCNNLLLLWKSARYLCSADQLNPRFVGWVILLFKKIASKETKMTYLPPIQKPITDYAAFFEMFYKSRELAKPQGPRLDLPAPACAFLIMREGRKH
jgi:hypothetical protein